MPDGHAEQDLEKTRCQTTFLRLAARSYAALSRNGSTSLIERVAKTQLCGVRNYTEANIQSRTFYRRPWFTALSVPTARKKKAGMIPGPSTSPTTTSRGRPTQLTNSFTTEYPVRLKITTKYSTHAARMLILDCLCLCTMSYIISHLQFVAARHWGWACVSLRTPVILHRLTTRVCGICHNRPRGKA